MSILLTSLLHILSLIYAWVCIPLLLNASVVVKVVFPRVLGLFLLNTSLLGIIVFFLQIYLVFASC